jgi:hypothetical protein
MKKATLFTVLLAVFVALATIPAMADVKRVTGTGPQLVVMGQDSVITGIFSVTVAGSGYVKIEARDVTYTAESTPSFELLAVIGGTDLLNRWLDLGTTYHQLENMPRRQWNNGYESEAPHYVLIECDDSIVVDFTSNTGTMYIFYETKAVKQDDVNYINAE